MRAIVAAMLLLLASCGTTRLYEGAPLPPDQAVRLEETSGPFSGVRTIVVQMDGKPLDEAFGRGSWEVRAGPHVMVARAVRIQTPFSRELTGDECTLKFTAEPGVTYELRSETSDTHPPLNLVLVDTRTGKTVVDDEPDSGQDCLSADVDYGGRKFAPVQWSTNASRSVVVLVPDGRTLKETDEWVELQCLTSIEGPPPDVDDVMKALSEAWEDSADDANLSVLARDEGAAPSLTFELTGAADDRRHGALVMLRTAGSSVHALMWFRETPALADADCALWRDRFARARLFEPAVR